MKFDLKKFLILNFPYVFIFWFFNRVGEGYRLAAGADVAAKSMGAISSLGEIISRNPLPSFHPQDLLVGLTGAACIRAAVYIKAKSTRRTASEEQFVFEGAVPAIIDEETWHNVQRLRETMRRTPKRSSGPNHLTGLLYCADCGAKLTHHGEEAPRRTGRIGEEAV